MLPLQKITAPHPIRFHPDQVGVLIALDQALEECGPHYGAQIMHPVVTELNALPLPPAQNRDAYFHGIMNILANHGIDPWQGKTVALVGYTRAEDDRSSLWHDDLQALLRGATVLDLSKEVTGHMLNSANARTLANDQKADFVITGNVLNAGDNAAAPADTMYACALLLKQGGKAIHLLSYGEGNFETAHLDNTLLLERIGQVHAYNYPDARPFSENSSPMAAMYLQEREVGKPTTAINGGTTSGPIDGPSYGKPPRGA